MSRRRALTALLLGACVGLGALVMSVGTTADAATAPPSTCKYKNGSPAPTSLWAQSRLNFEQVWPLTQGRSVRTGNPIRVAVIDSGFDARNPKLRAVSAAPTVNEIGGVPYDCVGHGTEVTSIIAAPPGANSAFVGVAPQVRIMPFKVTNSDQVAAAAITSALRDALDAGAQIINMSVQTPTFPPAAELAQLRRAENMGVVVVAAGGNDNGQSSGPQYPAALSPQFSNIIAVSAIDRSGAAANFGISGQYIDVAAPGQDVSVVERVSGYKNVQGTSYAAPYVTGTVALMLAANPGMTPLAVRSRLEATADSPPGTVPDTKYGYGVVNPLLAVTSVADDAAASRAAQPAAALPAPKPPVAPDRSVQHAALAAAFVLLALLVLTLVGAAVVRARRPAARGR